MNFEILNLELFKTIQKSGGVIVDIQTKEFKKNDELVVTVLAEVWNASSKTDQDAFVLSVGKHVAMALQQTLIVPVDMDIKVHFKLDTGQFKRTYTHKGTTKKPPK